MKLVALGLGLLQVLSFPAYVSPGVAPQAAQAIRLRGERAYGFLAGLLEVKPQLSLAILSEEEWPRFSDQVFGMPSLDEKESRLIVAGEKSVFWAGFVDLLKDQADPDRFKRVGEVYGQGGAAVDLSSFFDLLVIHELGHAFHLEAGVREFPRVWLQEFFANLALQTYVSAREPELLPRLLAFPSAMASLPAGMIERRTLADFGFPGVEGGVSPVNYVWYQAQFHLAAERVDRGGGAACLKFLATVKFPEIRTDGELSRFLADGPCAALSQVIDEWPQ